MIKIYVSPSCASCRKVLKWFDEQKIPYEEKNIFAATLNEKELKEILIKSENGTDDIISERSKIMKEQKIDVDSMTISQLVQFIRENPSVLKRPIMVDDHRIQVGYNSEEIRTFIPREARLYAEQVCNCKDCDECENCQNDIKEAQKTYKAK